MGFKGRYITRKEFFGKIVFDRLTATTEEIDRGTFSEFDKIPITPLSAPETVHLSITSRCNLDCPYCYSKDKRKDMSTMQLKRLIRQLSKAKVFQLAIGGGEPLLRDDIIELINYCNEKKIVANLTTNGTLLNESIAKSFKGKVGQINISFKNLSKTRENVLLLSKQGIRAGINLLVTSGNIAQVRRIITSLRKMPVESITILRPKPVKATTWYEQNKLRKRDMLRLKDILDQNQSKIRVDCSLVCLMDIPIEVLSSKAIYGCVAGLRFCTIKSNGDVFPCSFFDQEEYMAGNVLEENFVDIWRASKNFKNFRKHLLEIGGKCKRCSAFGYCKGCRVIALSECNEISGEERYCIK